MGWFDKKRKDRVETISMALDAPKPNTASILDGDENTLTPVEGLSLGDWRDCILSARLQFR